jgi:asparagine synthase (glutamine-hydrolysing)
MQLIASQMALNIAHRGPDDSGIWVDTNDGVVFAHRRLSIVDLSAAGHQPMASKSGRFVIVFNGEIYNHLELRRELDISKDKEMPVADQRWKGYSDTETLLAGFEAWGIEATLKKTVGMFAISLWDKDEKILTLARDRMGEKPLYYGFQKNTFMFGSELKAFKSHPDFLSEIDRDVICLYLRHNHIPAPYSIYKGIKKLLPGTYVQVRLNDDSSSESLLPITYWSLADVANEGLKRPFKGSDAEAIVAVDTQLKESIGLQMEADVPLGAFLSGGVDSTAVVALMQAQSGPPVKTFSIGFNEAGYNEAEYAMAVAKHLGTQHSELYVSSSDAMNVIPLLAEIYDEPFADSSQIPTYLVSKMAKQHVQVSLSGDAGDELFCGYNRYLFADNWKQLEHVPICLRKLVSQAINLLEPHTWDVFFREMNMFGKIPDNMGDKLEKLAKVMRAVNIQDVYYKLTSEIDQPELAVLGVSEPKTWLTKTGMKTTFNDAKLHMMFMDAMTYLPDDVLVKVDRASMANSLETRVPFLDHRVVELAWKLPIHMKIRDGKTKWILREVIDQYVPRKLIERPKAGFGIPLGAWLRGPLRFWVESLLNEQRLHNEGYFNVSYVRNLWKAHLSGRRNHQSLLWSILMFQAWLERAN